LAEHCESLSERIKLGHEFKDYLDQALERDEKGNYPELFHMRARFKYQIAGIGLIERGLATIFFGKIPHSTYEEALADFLISEEKTPDELENTLFIAKCYEKLGNVPKAIEYLKKLAGAEPIDAIDSEHIGEAFELLAKLDSGFDSQKNDDK
jgi:tetratricopeptide (TPR) repeat protein